MGTIRSSSYSSTTVLSDRLMGISDLDISGDPFESPLARLGDVKIRIQNLDQSINPETYLGRLVEVGMGHGTQMSDATSEVFFTGELQESRSDRDEVLFTARQPGQLLDKEIGTRVPETVLEKHKGNIYPISHGDHTDEHGYLPIIVNKPFIQFPEFVFDTKKWVDDGYDSIYLYDPESSVGMRARSTDKSQIGSDNNSIFFATEIGTLPKDMSGAELISSIKAHTVPFVDYLVETGDSLAAPTILKIGNELMLVVAHPNDDLYTSWPGEYVTLSRGWGRTKVEPHKAGDIIHRVDDDLGGFFIEIEHDFIADSMSNVQWVNPPYSNYASPPDYRRLLPRQTLFRTDPDDGKISVSYHFTDNSYGVNVSASAYSGLCPVFQKIGVSGKVRAMYVLGRFEAKANWSGLGGGEVGTAIYLTKGATRDGNEDPINFQPPGAGSDVVVHTARSNDLASTSCNTKNGNTTLVFDNIGDPEDTSKPMRSGIIYRFLVDDLSITKYPKYGDDYYLVDSSVSNLDTAERWQVTGTGTGWIDLWSLDGVDAPNQDALYRAKGSGDQLITAPGSTATKLYDSGEEEVAIEDIEDLDATRFNLIHRFSFNPSTPLENVSMSTKAERFGLRINFLASPVKYTFYVRAKGREHPGGYFNGSSGELIEAPSILLEDFLRNDVSDVDDTKIEETYFDQFHADRADWKMATTLFDK